MDLKKRLVKMQNKKKTLPCINSIDFDLVKMSIAPRDVLDFNSKQNLAKRTHPLSFKELRFELEKEQSSDDTTDESLRSF